MDSGEQREASSADDALELVREGPRREASAPEPLPDALGRAAARRRRRPARSRVAGWVHRRRDHGGLIFIDLRDRTGLLQLVFRPEEAPEAHAAAGALRGEDVISVSGELVRREEGAVNPDLPTGEVELVAAQLEQLADAETPPFQIDEDDPVGEELRLRYRYLDLRKERMRDNVILRHAGREGDPRLPLGRGLPRGRDADHDPLDPGGRARLPRAEPARAAAPGTRCRSRRSSSSSS